MVKNLEFNCRLAIISRRFLQNPQSARRKPPPAINYPHSAARTPSPAARRARLRGRATATRNPPRAVGLARPTVSGPLPATRCMRSAAIAFLRAIERGQPGFITRIPSSCPNAASHRTNKRTLAGGVASVRCGRGGTLSKERERGESARLRDMVWCGAVRRRRAFATSGTGGGRESVATAVPPTSPSPPARQSSPAPGRRPGPSSGR